MRDLQDIIKTLQIEDMIWIIYIFLSILAIISDAYEKDYEIHHSRTSYQLFHFLNLENLLIIFFIYLYFLYLAYRRFKKEHGHVSIKKDLLNDVGLLANILFVIAGLLSIFTEYFSKDSVSINLLN